MKVRAIYGPRNPFTERYYTATTEWIEVPDDSDMQLLELQAKNAAPIGHRFSRMEVKEDEGDAKQAGDEFVPEKAGDRLLD